MGKAVKTSPITAAPPFTVALTTSAKGRRFYRNILFNLNERTQHDNR
jgi:hypothetical protein